MLRPRRTASICTSLSFIKSNVALCIMLLRTSSFTLLHRHRGSSLVRANSEENLGSSTINGCRRTSLSHLAHDREHPNSSPFARGSPSKLARSASHNNLGEDLEFGSNGGCSRPHRTRFGHNGGSDSDSMEAYYLNLLQMDPDNPLLLRNLAQYLNEVKGDIRRSEHYYARAILAFPADGDTLSQYAKLQWDAHRDADRANAYFTQAVQTAPDDCYVIGSYASFLWESEEKSSEDASLLLTDAVYGTSMEKSEDASLLVTDTVYSTSMEKQFQWREGRAGNASISDASEHGCG